MLNVRPRNGRVSQAPHRIKVPAVVRALSAKATVGWLECGGRRFRCALGRSGRSYRKREGDGTSPRGAWPIRAVLFRRDRSHVLQSGLQRLSIRPNDGWCDASADPNYNRPVAHPYRASAERLWRADGLYDIVVVLGYNDRPRRRGGGSAIFMHLARRDYGPTAGCIALSRRDLQIILAMIRIGSSVRI